MPTPIPRRLNNGTTDGPSRRFVCSSRAGIYWPSGETERITERALTPRHNVVPIGIGVAGPGASIQFPWIDSRLSPLTHFILRQQWLAFVLFANPGGF